MTERGRNVVIRHEHSIRLLQGLFVVALVLGTPVTSSNERAPSLAVPASSVEPEAAITASPLTEFDPLLEIRLPPMDASTSLPDRRQIGVGRQPPGSHQGDISDRLLWLSTPGGGLVTTFQVASSDAAALRLGVGAVLPGQASLRFVAPTGDGQAYIASRRYMRADFVRSDGSARPVWSPVLHGETAGVEVLLPLGTAVGDLSIEVIGISHIGDLTMDRPLVSGGNAVCEPVDAMCSRAYLCELDAALRLTYTDTAGNSYACSATAVNDRRTREKKLAAPSVLTSHDCLSNAYDAETVTAIWNQRTTVCGSATLTSKYRELSGGAELLASDPASNHTLLRLHDPVPTDTDYCLAGWSTGEDVLQATAAVIHHGESGFKEWTEGEVTEKADFTLPSGQTVSGFKIAVSEGALWTGSVGAGWFIEGEDGRRGYIGVQSSVSGEDCGVASVGSFAAFFDAAGSPHLGEAVETDDHGNTAAVATVVDIGASGTVIAEGVIGSADDVDAFKVHLGTAGILTAFTRGNIDTVGRLATEDGVQVARDDDGGAGGNFRIVADVEAGAYVVEVGAFEEATGDYTLVVTFAPHAVPRTLTYPVPLFLAAGDANREGFLRVINHSEVEGTVAITAIDDLGRSHGPVYLALGAGETVHLNSGDLERGNRAKDLPTGVGNGDGDWRLLLESNLHLTPQAFVRTTDGFVTSVHDVVGHAGRSHRVVFFNPGSNANQRSVLRLVNPTPDRVSVTITGRDDAGRNGPGGAVRLSLAGGASMSVTSEQLENGSSETVGRLGDGTGKWELAVAADGEIWAMSLLATPTGHLTNLSMISSAREIPLFLVAGGAREGFLRVINNSGRTGSVTVTGWDAAGTEYGPVSFELGPREAKHFNSGDLEQGNESKGLTGRLGDGTGSWRLALSSGLDVTAQAYVRTGDGFVTSMHEQVPRAGLTYDVAFFNPGSNHNQQSRLQLTNLLDREVGVAIESRDDAGDSGSSTVTFALAAREVRMISAQALEAGRPSFNGRLGNGFGKWQLALSANGQIEVVNLLETPTGHLTNLSTVAAKPLERAFNDVFIEPDQTELVAVDGALVEAASNQILVFLENEITSAELRAIEDLIVARGGDQLALDTRLRSIQVGIGDDVEESAFIETVSSMPGVHTAGVNAVLAPDGASARPLANPGASFRGDYWIDHVHAESAWAALTSVSLRPSTIGIVDTGIRTGQAVVDHARLRRFTASGLPARGYFGTSNRGLLVTGFAAGEHSGDQRGVNTRSDVVLVDVERRGIVYESALLNGIETAIDNGAQVVNVSFGDGAACADSRTARLAARERWRRIATNVLDYARKQDVLVVFSAGSDCEKADDRYLPLEVASDQTHAWESHALIVGASTDQRADACFSRMGDVVDLLAPGREVSFGPARPLLDGTSYAAPFVTGTAGLVRAIDHTLSAAETRLLLLGSASESITYQTADGNETRCADRFPAGATADNRPGAATTPDGLLNLGVAVASGVVVASVPRTNVSKVTLRRDRRIAVPVEVHVPSTGVASADIVFLVDQTGSFEDDVETLKSKADAILADLGNRGVDVRFGVAGFADYPAQTDGPAVFTLHQDITDSVSETKSALDDLANALLQGGDAPEAQYEALYRATRDFSWRVGALRVILLATDAPFHDSDKEPDYPGTGREATLARLQGEDVVVIGLLSGDDAGALSQLRELALATGGNVHELDMSSSEIATAIEEGVDEVLGSVDVKLEVLAAHPSVLGVTPFAHRGVSPGTTVTFAVHLEGQLDSSIDPITRDIDAWAWGDGSALVGRTRIPVVVPSEPPWRLLGGP